MRTFIFLCNFDVTGNQTRPVKRSATQNEASPTADASSSRVLTRPGSAAGDGHQLRGELLHQRLPLPAHASDWSAGAVADSEHAGRGHWRQRALRVEEADGEQGLSTAAATRTHSTPHGHAFPTAILAHPGHPRSIPHGHAFPMTPRTHSSPHGSFSSVDHLRPPFSRT